MGQRVAVLGEMLRKARRIILRRGVSPDDVDDLVQEAFLRLESYERAHRVQSREGFLVTTAVNLAIDRSRRQSRSPFEEPARSLDLVADPGPGAALDRPPVEAVTAWRRGEMMFDETSLIDAAAELNRYGTVHVVVADPSIASLRVSGVFTTRDVGEFAQAIAALHGLRVERDVNVLRLTRKPGARGDSPRTL